MPSPRGCFDLQLAADPADPGVELQRDRAIACEQAYVDSQRLALSGVRGVNAHARGPGEYEPLSPTYNPTTDEEPLRLYRTFVMIIALTGSIVEL